MIAVKRLRLHAGIWGQRAGCALRFRRMRHRAAACKGKPTVLIAKTTKGKGVSFMENNAGWHGKAPNDEQYAQAKAEVEAKLAELEGK